MNSHITSQWQLRPRRQTLAVLTVFAVLTSLSGAVHAGRTCEPRRQTPERVARSLQLAQRTAQVLESAYTQRGTQVVLLARAGQDLRQYGLRYSHLGWAYRSVEGPWRVIHKLNQCGTAVARVYRQGLGEFFLDDLWRDEAAWVEPNADIQRQVWSLLQAQPGVPAVHESAYSMVSYAWGLTYQQSNQWAIEAVAAAVTPSTAMNRRRAQSWLRQQGYQPTTLRLGPLTRLGGRMASSNIAFDDHPPEMRYSNRIDTVTVDSIFDWLQRTQRSGPVQRL